MQKSPRSDAEHEVDLRRRRTWSKWTGDVVKIGDYYVGSYSKLAKAGYKDAHHIIQDAAVRNIKGYNTRNAPAIHLAGPARKRGTPHHKATQSQRIKGRGGSYASERQVAYDALIAAGVPANEVAKFIQYADQYFLGELGMTMQLTTRIPSNRNRN